MCEWSVTRVLQCGHRVASVVPLATWRALWPCACTTTIGPSTSETGVGGSHLLNWPHGPFATAIPPFYRSADAESQDPDGPSAVPQRSTGPPPTLVEYMDAFTADVQNGTSHLKSLETLNVVEGYARALWGDAPQLLRNAGDPSESRVPRKRNDVPPPKVDTPTLSVGGGQRILLEAVAFGAFLRDAERHLELTAPAPLFTPNPRKPPVPP